MKAYPADQKLCVCYKHDLLDSGLYPIRHANWLYKDIGELLVDERLNCKQACKNMRKHGAIGLRENINYTRRLWVM